MTHMRGNPSYRAYTRVILKGENYICISEEAKDAFVTLKIRCFAEL